MAKKNDRPLILIADDEPHIIELIKLSLGDCYRYMEAEDGEKAYDMLCAKRPDLIILDVMMPGLNGFELCERLKCSKDTKDIPIAMVSAKTMERDIIQGLRLGADQYIIKPFDPDELQANIQKLLSGR